MARGYELVAIIGFSVSVMAADASWRSKPVSEWSEEDARQILAASPWSQTVQPAILPELTAGQRQAGGATGGGNGQALRTLNGNTLAGLLRGSQQPAKSPPPASPALKVRWESALPIRAAEMKAREIGAPDWDGDYYVIAVDSVPGLRSDRKGLTAELGRAAFLRSDTRKSARPLRVEIQTEAGGLSRIVYFFPRIEFGAGDSGIEFVAQFGRFSLAANFDFTEMKLQRKLEL
jgi:hypothetical protein